PRGPVRPPSGGAPVPGGRQGGGAGSRPGAGGHARPPVPDPVGTAPLPRLGPPGAGPGPATGSQPVVGARGRWRGARSELRRQLREHKRVRATAMAMVIALLVGAPLIHLGIQTAARDPVLNSLAALPVPEWAAESPEDRIIGGSRWCLMDCRFRERRLVSQRGPDETYEVYRTALLAAGWVPRQVGGCPLVAGDGHYTCWTRDEYTLDLWVHVPACALDPRNLRPDVPEDDQSGPAEIVDEDEDCTGSVVEIKMQNRVADERGLPGARNPTVDQPGGTPSPGGSPSPGTGSPSSPPAP